MGLFGSLLKTVITVVETPIAITKDILTLGGELTDKKVPYTAEKIDELGKNVEEIKESLDDI